MNAVKPFKEHKYCKGCSSSYLDCTYEEERERRLLAKILDSYIEQI